MSAETQGAETRIARIDRLIRDVEDAASRVGEWYADEDDEAPFDAVSASLESARHFLNEALLSDYARLAAVERERDEARRALEEIGQRVNRPGGTPSEIAENVRGLRDEFNGICERLQEAAQRHHLGLGGEHIDRLVVDALDWTTEWAATTDTLLDALLIWGGHNADCWHQRRRDSDSECFCGWDYYRVKMQRARAALAARPAETPEGR